MDRVLTEYQHRIKARLSNVADQYTVSIPPPPPIMTTEPALPGFGAALPGLGAMTMPNIYQQIQQQQIESLKPGSSTFVKKPTTNEIQWFNIISYILGAVVVFVIVAIFYFVFNMQYD